MSVRRLGAAAAWTVDSPAAVPGLVVVCVFLGWTARDDSLLPTAWYPAALLLLACLGAAALIAGRAATTPRRHVLLPLGALAAFAAWSYLSVLWADVKADAWDGANRTLVYVAAYALFALWAWRPRPAAALLATASLATAGILIGFLAAAAAADDPERYFLGGRFEAPTGYANATCALALVALWPALVMATRRETPTLLRAALLAAAGVLAEIAVLTQSRGSLFAAPIVLVLYLVLARPRGRSLLFVLLLAAAVGAALPALLDVFGSTSDIVDYRDSVDRAFRAVALSGGVLAVVGLAAALVDRRLAVSSRTARRLDRATGIGELAVVVALVVVLAAGVGDPAGRAADAWQEFTAVDAGHGGRGGSRFLGGFETSRGDAWRIAWRAFLDDPFHGRGADNFAVDYLKDRRSEGALRSPHSLEMRVLAQTGAVGALLFLSFLVLAVLAVFRPRRDRASYGGALALAGLAGFAYWIVHGSVDRFWDFPELGVPALAFLGLAASVDRIQPPAAEGARLPRRMRVAGIGALCLVGLVAAVSYLLPALAAREVDDATAAWRTDPAAALARLDRARVLNALSDRPDLVAGEIAARVGDLERARLSFARALERNPTSWIARVELAAVYSVAGDPETALGLLEEAAALNPQEPLIAEMAEEIGRGESVPPGVLADRLLEPEG